MDAGEPAEPALDAAVSGAAGEPAAGSDGGAAGGSGADAAPEPACTAEESRPCYTGAVTTRGRGECKDGRQACEGGTLGECKESVGPTVEQCNALDDDCDGTADEGIAVTCYSGATGCREQGAFRCMGSCSTGTQRCVDGMLGACEGESLPAAESCTGDGAAADEDCDGQTDEGCECRNGQRRTCYGGPAGTLGVGTCLAGNQTCVAGAWAGCVGSVEPDAESCANPGSDDDCNAVVDDVALLETTCAGALPGGCATGRWQCVGAALACVTPQPVAEVCNQLDDDCDGTPDNGFNLNADEANCGACGMACAAGDACCTGECRTPLLCSTKTPVCAVQCAEPPCPSGRLCPIR
jgi:hypothetical protein